MHKVTASAAVVLLLLTVPVSAQLPRRSSGWGATIVLAPVLFAHGGLAARCNPLAAERAEWGVNRIGKLLKLSDVQRAALDEVRAATITAADLKAGACPADLPRKSADRLSFAAKRLEALRKATATIVPRFEAFYMTLSEEQKAQLDAGPRRWSLR